MQKSEPETGAALLDTEPPTMLYVVKQLELAVRARLDELLKPMNITVLQYTALTVLARRDGVSSAELARNSFVTAQTMGEMVTNLESKGMVARRADASNRRRMHIDLTDAGRQLLARCDAGVRELEQHMLGGLSDEQRHGLRENLIQCRRALDGS
ncbi:MarR family winged helix-turn-helix transcriptional regulator [Rhodococcoides yunnanense]|uniref:MarR family winged helix-turn-helix transcriptional regulator n=1 Tax=Rhodococcoides yunnanense TaxID=278209 RepID=UPI000934FC49|nr:MarR family transcriptional regulator [Rhodococcus yunnanensis]